MRIWKWGGLTVAALVVAGAVTAGVYAWRAVPQTSGELKVPALSMPVMLTRDFSDVVHISAQSKPDAWRALGYVHAQERLWQLEFNRRVMHGQLAEILGEAALPTDKLLRTLGIMPTAKRQLAQLHPEARQAATAYVEGINAFIQHREQALSPEFLILGVEPTEWAPEDVVGWSLMMALDLGGNWNLEFARLQALQQLDTSRMWQLLPPYEFEPPAGQRDLSRTYRDLGVFRTSAPPSTAAAAPASAAPSALTAWATDYADALGDPFGRGSNNWVIDGSRTLSGKPLLANDPHLGLSAPAVWFFASLQAPNLSVVGATLPGMPFVVLGRNERVAWGFTNTGPDVQDLYLEAIDPNDPTRYRTPDGWANFETRTETIPVKGREAETLTIRSTRHGPVLSDVQPAHQAVIDTDRYVLALRWSALEDNNQTLYAGIRMNEAGNVAELIEAGSYHHSPMQSVVMADVEGNIAFKAFGTAPLRRADNDILGLAPSLGWEPRYDWDGWLPYDDTPQNDGAAGWIATANQRVMPDDYPFFIGQDWARPYRYERIRTLIERTAKHDVGTMRDILGDQLSLGAVRLLPFLQRAQSAHPQAEEAQQALDGFEGVMAAGQPAPLLFAVWADELARGIIAPRLGDEVFASLYGRRHFREAVERILETNDTWWCGPAGCAPQVDAAFTRALERLVAEHGTDVEDWRWGDVHVALSEHRPFGQVAALAPFFNVSVPSGGDDFTVNVGRYNVAGEHPFVNHHAASLRAIYDLEDLERSRFIYQTGQSGVVFSPRYRDMREPWVTLRDRPLLLRSPLGGNTLLLLP